MPPSQISFKIHNEDISLISTGAEVTASEESKGSAGSGRTSVILATLAFYQLLGTGVLAALVAIRQPDKTIGFSCALAAAVNAVALGHYMAIWRVRSQAVRAKEKVAGGDQDVEVLRHSDWAVSGRCSTTRRPPPPVRMPNKSPMYLADNTPAYDARPLHAR